MLCQRFKPKLVILESHIGTLVSGLAILLQIQVYADALGKAAEDDPGMWTHVTPVETQIVECVAPGLDQPVVANWGVTWRMGELYLFLCFALTFKLINQ